MHHHPPSISSTKLLFPKWQQTQKVKVEQIPIFFSVVPTTHGRGAVVVGDVAIGEAIHQDAVEDLAPQPFPVGSMHPKACQILQDLPSGKLT